MSRTRVVVLALGVAMVVAVVAFLMIRDDDDGKDADAAASQPSASSELPVVADETWCAGWENLVASQGQYVASPTPEATATLLAVVDELQTLGAPESLDPAGYTELTAVLDDIRASVDPSFTPSVVPSEPADVAIEDDDDHEDHDDHEGDEHEDHGADADEAPFGAWLAQYCSS